MDNKMARLILVPQYPTPLRYQEWWLDQFPKEFGGYFDSVITLGYSSYIRKAPPSQFAPLENAIQWEMQQMDEYMQLSVRKDDVLLLCDLSFPGLFSSVLLHKRPERCYAICHATSKNRYDYFGKIRGIKYPIEKATSKLFDKVIVASEYHKEKLGWDNIRVVPLPMPPVHVVQEKKKTHMVVSVARPGIQKENQSILRRLSKLGVDIDHPNCTTWTEYYNFLSESRILLITSKEETYGYQVVDAIMCGCTPIAPNKYSYPELIDNRFLYNNFSSLIDILTTMLQIWGIHKVAEIPCEPLATLKTESKAINFYKTIAQIMTA